MYIQTLSLNPYNVEALKGIVADNDSLEILKGFLDAILALPEKQQEQWVAFLEPTQAPQSHSKETLTDAGCRDKPGRAKGFAEGFAKGVVKGEHRAKLEIACRSINVGFGKRTIMLLTQLSETAVNTLFDEQEEAVS